MDDNPFGDLPTPTHPPLDIMKLFEIVEGLAGHVGDGELNAAAITDYAKKEGLRPGEVYAASIFDPSMEFVASHDARIEVCTGRCQLFGGIDLVDRLSQLREQRLADGKPGFDILPRNCLDQCDFPPVVRTVSAAGTYDHRNVAADSLEELVGATCDPT